MTADAPANPRSPLAGVTSTPLRLMMLGGWLMLVAWLAAHHVFWRDEVRALNFALSGDDLIGMFSAVHGDSHPALWFLMLRLAHDLVPVREVLPAMALGIGICIAALIAWRAPFGPVVIGVALFSAWLGYEYTVVARDYGLAALLIVVIADQMARGNRNGLTLGILLAMLCNANVPVIPIAGGFLLFWLVEILADRRSQTSAVWRQWSMAAALTMAGTLACFLVVYPTFNDAAVRPLPSPMSLGRLLLLLTNLSLPLTTLLPPAFMAIPGMPVALTLLLLAGPVSLMRSPAGIAASLAVLVAMALFFQLVYPGSYRHAAEYLVFLLALHWMVAAGRGGGWSPRVRSPWSIAPEWATAGFVALLALQTMTLALIVIGVATGYVASRSRDFGLLLARTKLTNAVVIAEADPFVEALHYYSPNPAWLVREGRWSHIPHFTRHAKLDLDLDDLLGTARRLQRNTQRPVVIALARRLEPHMPARRDVGDYGYSFSSTPAQADRFLGATKRLARFGPATTDESYDVYLLKPALTAS